MRSTWNLAAAFRAMRVAALAAALAAVLTGWLLAGCGGQTSVTTVAPSTTISSPPTSGPTTTASSAPTTAAPTTTTLALIIPGVPSAAYVDREFGFSVTRPESAAVVTTGFEGYLPLTQTPVAALTLPEDLFAGTNLDEAGVYVGVSSAAGATSGWDKPAPDSGETAAGTVEIGGVTFAVFTSSEGAAGNIYDSRIYRTLHGGACFEIVELLHSGEIGNYPPDVKEFDRAAFAGYLEAMVRSFAFTSAS